MNIWNLKNFIKTSLILGLLAVNLPAQAFLNRDEIVIPENYPKQFDVEYIKCVKPLYKNVSEEHIFYVAMEMLKNTNGEFSRRAILGNNLSQKPIRVMFKDLGQIRSDYADFDALGWKKSGKLYIFINPKHKDAPPGAIAALLAHEALHQDEYNSIAEETYAWTMEASVWCDIVAAYPESNDPLHPLVVRENTLKDLFEKGNYSSKYIKKTVKSNQGYRNLPATSPGFEDL
ncbi:hypothetical protein J6A31_02915 [bacterium]|nr:hypothetical protein [bacterium]